MPIYRIFYFIAAFLIIACAKTPDPAPLLNAGVPRAMAQYRKKQLADVTYELSFHIPDKIADSIRSSLKITLSIQDLQEPLYIDFSDNPQRLHLVVANGEELPIHYEKEHIIIPTSHLKLGVNTLKIDFTAGELSLNRNEDFLYTLLVPDRARTLFPCFDQPDIKAKYRLRITAPKGWKVLCGGPLEHMEEKGSYRIHQFQETDIMSTYLFSFVAGTFEAVSDSTGLSPMQMLYRETDPEKIKASIDTIFKLHRHAKRFMESYTNISFPFKKMDFATLPAYQYGGMEHVGAIQYRESSLFLDNSATQAEELNRAKLIAHETAHMWFGDLVTMKWFSDVWLKEVFANLMADKIINPAFPEVDHELQFLLGHYPSAYEVDRSRGSNPIRQALDNLNNAGSLYGSIIYHKAPIMMRQLERILGAKLFQEGLVEYLKTYAYQNADWDDLIALFDQRTEMDLKRWSDVWVHASGRPVIHGSITHDEAGGIQRFKISQEAEDGSDKLWPQQFEIAFVYADTVRTLPINLYDKEILVKAVESWPVPKHIRYNSNGMGYGVFPTTISSMEDIPEIKRTVSRGAAYINGYENALLGNFPLEKVLDLFSLGLSSEPNEIILKYLTSAVNELFWNYLPEEKRSSYGSLLEKVLLNRLWSNDPPTIKKTIFGLYRSVAYSESGTDHLYKIWSKEIKIPNLILNDDDHSALAMLLAVYQHPQTEQILQKAQAAISNPDKQKRFIFLLPSLSEDPAVRGQFFESFKQAKNREKESWVASACYYIHHPLRQDEGIKKLALSLELLDEIAATGDIFFPKAWLDNTIGRYTSKEAYSILTSFLSTHPNLNSFLRNKILQATDPLYRVQLGIPRVSAEDIP